MTTERATRLLRDLRAVTRQIERGNLSHHALASARERQRTLRNELAAEDPVLLRESGLGAA